MLKIKTYVDKSEIEGLGLFAAEEIKIGDVVWVYVPGFDQAYSQQEFISLPMEAQSFIRRYGYKEDDVIFFTGDNDRYINHSSEPNTKVVANGDVIAIKPIAVGQEITANYQEFDTDFHQVSDYSSVGKICEA